MIADMQLNRIIDLCLTASEEFAAEIEPTDAKRHTVLSVGYPGKELLTIESDGRILLRGQLLAQSDDVARIIHASAATLRTSFVERNQQCGG